MLKNSLTIPSIDLHSARANFLWALSLQAIEKAAGYFVLAILTRVVAKEQLGLMFFAATISSLAATVLSYGTDSYLIRAVSADRPRALDHFSRVLSLKIVNAIVIFAGLNMAFAVIDKPLQPVLLLVTGYDFLEEIYYCFSAFFTGEKRLIFRLLVSGSFELLTLGGVSAVALITRSLIPVLWTYFVLDAALLVVVYWVVRRYFGAIRFIWHWKDTLKLLRASTAFFILSFLTLVLTRFDTILVGLYLNFQQVANYELGIKLVEVTRFMVRPLSSVFFPIFTEYVVDAHWHNLRLRFWQLTAFVFGLGLVLYIGMELFGVQLIVWLFGASYRDSVPAAQILFLSVPFMFASYVATIAANSMHLEKAAVYALVASVALDIGLDLYMIPTFGIVGAAWATVASQALLLFIMLPMIVQRIRKQPALPLPVVETSDTL